MNMRVTRLAVVTALLIPGLPGLAQAQEVLRLNNWLPPGHTQMTGIIEPWMKKVEEATDGRVKIQKIADYDLHLYGSKDYLAGHPPVTQLSDLRHLRGIGYVPDMIFDKELDYIPLIDPGFRPHLTSTSVHVQLEAVLNGAGVAIVHDFMAERHPDLQRVLPKEISFTRAFWSVVHEDYAEVERIRVCVSAIVEHMRKRLKPRP